MGLHFSSEVVFYSLWFLAILNYLVKRGVGRPFLSASDLTYLFVSGDKDEMHPEISIAMVT